MTVVRPAPVQEHLPPASVAPVHDRHRLALDRLLDADPLVNAVLVARLATTRTLDSDVLGGAVLGVQTPSGLTAAAFHGGNLLPVGGSVAEWRLLAEHLAAARRVCTSVVGRAETVAEMWPLLEQSWGSARAIRYEQPLLALRRGDAMAHDMHPQLRLMRRGDVDRYVPAAAAMFAEELGVSPFAGRAGGSYRRRIEGLVAGGRALGIVDRDGSIVFKADLAVLTRATCQVQGVWVRPDLRGRGIGTAAMAGVLAHALRLAPTVSLYVNDFNAAARAVYARLGMRQVATLSTVLL